MGKYVGLNVATYVKAVVFSPRRGVRETRERLPRQLTQNLGGEKEHHYGNIYFEKMKWPMDGTVPHPPSPSLIVSIKSLHL